MPTERSCQSRVTVDGKCVVIDPFMPAQRLLVRSRASRCALGGSRFNARRLTDFDGMSGMFASGSLSWDVLSQEVLATGRIGQLLLIRDCLEEGVLRLSVSSGHAHVSWQSVMHLKFLDCCMSHICLAWSSLSQSLAAGNVETWAIPAQAWWTTSQRIPMSMLSTCQVIKAVPFSNDETTLQVWNIAFPAKLCQIALSLVGVFLDAISCFAAYLHDSTSAVLVVGTCPWLRINVCHLQSLLDSSSFCLSSFKRELEITRCKFVYICIIYIYILVGGLNPSEKY